jgi:hypothetical protein
MLFYTLQKLLFYIFVFNYFSLCFSFTPLLYDNSGNIFTSNSYTTCEESVYTLGTEESERNPNSDTLTLSIFDAGGPDSNSFADGGEISLVGGIEVAIHPSLCRRLLRLSPSSPFYKSRCDNIERSMRKATEIWSRHHPLLYFNWTTQIDKAELVFVPGSDVEFSRPDMSLVLAYETEIRASGHSLPVKIVRGTMGHRLSSRLTRRKIVVNPLVCIFETDAHIRACNALGSNFAFNLVIISTSISVITMLLPLGRFGKYITIRGRVFFIVLFILASLTSFLLRPLSALQYLSLINIFIAFFASLYYVLNDLTENQVNSHIVKLSENSSVSMSSDSSHSDLDITLPSQRELQKEIEDLNELLKEDPVHFSPILENVKEDLVKRIQIDKEKIKKREMITSTTTTIVQKKQPWKASMQFRCTRVGGSCISGVLLSSLVLLFIGKRLESCGNANPARLLWGGINQTSFDRQFATQCFRIDDVLAHEVGHALGLGHPDKGTAFLSSFSSVLGVLNSSDYVKISAKNPCDGIKMDRVRNAAHTFKGSIMYSSVVGSSAFSGSTKQPLKLSEDDLAGLFFLYPSDTRKREWGNFDIPLKSYSIMKLNSYASTFLNGSCAKLLRRADIAECILAMRLRLSLTSLNLMMLNRCGINWRRESDTRIELCESLESLIHGVRRSAALAVADEMTPSLANEYLSFLHKEQQRLEAALYDAPIHVTGYNNLDHALIFLARGVHHDIDGDGVHDDDSDADGLPDVIEIGLNALQELLRDAVDGQLSRGGWIVAGEQEGKEFFLEQVNELSHSISQHNKACRHGQQQNDHISLFEEL